MRPAREGGLTGAGSETKMAAIMTQRFFLRTGLAIIGILFAWTASAYGQAFERLGDFNDWSAFRFTENGAKACFMASQPIKAEGNYKERGDIYALVTHWPADNARDEVSIVAGYKYKDESFVNLSIGGTKFRLFTRDDVAWTPNADEDGRLVKSMIKGAKMVVQGTSWRGTKTKDTYSLKGFTAAYKKINEICGS